MSIFSNHGVMLNHRFKLKYLRSCRKIFLATFIFICFVIFTFFNRNHELDLSLLSSNDDISLVVSDLKIVRCIGNCSPPTGYIKLEPSLNYKTSGLFNYFAVVKKQPLNEATRVLVDIVPNGEGDVVRMGKYALGVKWMNISPVEEIPDVEMVRSVEILMGMGDLVDAREGWKSLKIGSPHPSKKSLQHISTNPRDENTPSGSSEQDVKTKDESEITGGDSPSENPDKQIKPRMESAVVDDSTVIGPLITFFKLSPSREQSYTSNRKHFEALKSQALFPTTSNKFKIIQLSDLHFGQSLGKCIDGSCSSDLRTLRFIDESIRLENPDLVIITGDLIDLSRSIDYKSVILKVLQPILHNNIKFIFTFGDEFQGLSNAHEIKMSILTFLSSLPNCYNVVNYDPNLYGLTNYNIKVIYNEKDAVFITLLDSQDQKLDDSQMNYLYRLNNQEQSIFKLLFFHYPLPQFRPAGRFKLLGTYNEKHPLNSKTNEKFLADIYNCGYNVVSVGHEHENDACISSEIEKNNDLKKIWLCYNAITGDSGDTKLNKDYDRKVRFFEINLDSRKLFSWKRSELQKKPFDYQLIHKF